MNKKTLCLLLAIPLLFIASCNKHEGFGGNSTISGRVQKVIHSDEDYQLHQDTVDGSDIDIYIQFGNDNFYGDRIKTGKGGAFEFRYLTKGDYTVYAFSELPSGEKIPVEIPVRVASAGKTSDIGNIYVHEGKAFGTSLVKGRIGVRYFNGQGTFVGNGSGAGERVYIRVKGSDSILDDIRTNENGTFVFRRLTPGTYEVIAYSQDPSTEIPYPIIVEIVVAAAGQVFAIPSVIELRLKA